MEDTDLGAQVSTGKSELVQVGSEAEFAAQLEKLAMDIEHQERTAIFKIARRLAAAHELFLYRRDEGGFSGWVERRLGYSRSKAYELLNVAKWLKVSNAADTFGTLPVKAIYLLAAPSTPESAREEVLDRLKTGERVTYTIVTEIIARATPDETGDTKTNNTGTNNTKTGDTDNVIPFSDQKTGKEHVEAGRRDDGGADQRDDDAADGGRDGGDHADDGAANSLTPAKTPKSTPKKKTSPRTIWEATEKEWQIIRDDVLEAYFAQATGSDVFDRIPEARRTEVVRGFLDRLTVVCMLAEMSDAFGKALRDRLPAPKAKSGKGNKPFRRGINLDSKDFAVSGTSAGEAGRR